MYGIAIMGYGVVGSGVAEAIRLNSGHIYEKTGERLAVLKILDIFDYPESPDASLITHDVNDIMFDNDVKIVVETIGGVGAAYQFTKMAFENGKHVVTSNKELVATHGPELLKMADDNEVLYLFEASTGGGIPVVRPLEQCLIANRIDEIMGILNGTTNYMLTYMKEHGVDFSESLKLAQEKGYAEKDPSADIDGHDACRKIAILSSIAFGRFVDYNDFCAEGISNITVTDIRGAEVIGCVIKLIARSKRVGEKVVGLVCPMMIDRRMMLANTDGVFNGIVIKGNIVDDVMLYGRGAGKLPTASAVVADIVDIMRYGLAKKNYKWDRDKRIEAADIADEFFRYFVRLDASERNRTDNAVEEGNVDAAVNMDGAGDRGELIDMVLREFPEAIILPVIDAPELDTLIFTTGVLRERDFNNSLEKIKKGVSRCKSCNFIRIYTESAT